MDSQSSSKINYMFIPSLKRLALIKVASTLWSQSDVKDLISEKISCDNGTSECYRKIIENEVAEKVSELKLPGVLQKLLIPYIYRVGFQILDWIDFHVVQCDYVTFKDLPNEFFWTPQGTIDYKKVAETIVHNERIEMYHRFKLACIYCLEDSIKFLWKQLPNRYYKKRSDKAIIMFWSYYMAGDLNQLYKDFNFPSERDGANRLTPFQLAFKISYCTNNEIGTRYFLHRLTSEERDKMLAANADLASNIALFNPHDLKHFPSHHFAHIFCYLFSEMKEHEQAALIKDAVVLLLSSLLVWPWQCFFLSTVKKIWNQLVKEDYFYIVHTISEEIYSGTKVYDYRKLFGKIWQLGSATFKRHVILKDGLVALSYNLCKVGDKENMELIFNAATMLEKEEFIFSPEGQLRCRNLIEVGNWSLLKFFIQECTSSKEVFHKLKEILKKSFCSMKKHSNMSNEFYQFLTDIEQERKRKYVADDVNNLTKKLHSSS